MRSCATHTRCLSAVFVAALLVGLFFEALFGGEAVAQERCKPAARVSGEPALVASVTDVLHRRGISTTATAACRPIHVTLARADERTVVTITDAEGRVVERVAIDAQSVATTIESWARRDLSDPLLATRSGPQPVEATIGPTSARPEGVFRRAPGVGRQPPRFELVAALQSGLSGDGALWAGIRARGCARVGAFCFGAMIGYSKDTEVSGLSLEYQTTRSALDLVLIANRPFERGRFTLSPGVGVGQSAITARAMVGAIEEDDYKGNFHLRAHLDSTVYLSGAWSLAVDLAVGYNPFATTILDKDEPVPLAGVPRIQTWLGVGLSYGGL